MKKTTWLKTAIVSLQTIPVTLVTLYNFPVFVEQASTGIAAVGALLGLFLALIFRENFKEFFKTPSTFKISLVIFLLSLIAVNIGEQFLVISGTVVASTLVSTPLTTIYENVKSDDNKSKILDDLKGLVDKNERI